MTNESVVVSLFTQTLKNDVWIDNGINQDQSLKIKESILSSARALKIAIFNALADDRMLSLIFKL